MIDPSAVRGAGVFLRPEFLIPVICCRARAAARAPSAVISVLGLANSAIIHLPDDMVLFGVFN